ncbi:vinexin isoform X3 [Dendropsophus ebraccatus]|uniref:vinexin isoform X3 n=1 Tax=Dendropsophus ebraccatus TaxID=150705 RepID=UPI0038322C6A
MTVTCASPSGQWTKNTGLSVCAAALRVDVLYRSIIGHHTCKRQQEALQGMDPDLPLSLDDFIPPHLQKKQNRGASQNHDAYTDGFDGGDYYYKATLVLTDDVPDIPSPQTQRRYIRYEGIGPTDKDGMPFASRSSVDKPREWYKNMYRVLHQMSDSEDSDGDGNWSKTEDNNNDIFTASKFITAEKNSQSELQDPQKRSQEPSHLHITVKSTIREAPSKASNTLKIETSPRSSKPHATTLPRSSSRHPSQTSPPHYSSKVSHHISNINTVRSSPNHNTQQVSSTSSKKQTSEPVPQTYFFPDHSSRHSHNDKETSSLHKSKYSSSAGPTSHILSPTSRKSTSKMLEQLESDLRNFTEELDKDLEARQQRAETTLEQCEKVVSQKYSHRAGGSPEPKGNKSSRQYTEEPNLSPISKAAVKFDFLAESEKEISLQRGTMVNILKKVDDHWLLGEQGGRRGLFPASYVKVLSSGELEPSDTPQLSGIALYDFKADSAAELPLRKGQRVLINRRVGGNWFEGRVEGTRRLGLFPASYVQVTDGLMQARKVDTVTKRAAHTNPIEQASSPLTLKEKPCIVKAPASNRLQELRGTMYRVVFNYSPKSTDELQLSTGDIVTVTQQCDDGWYVGVCWRTQKFGTFPGNFVVPYETS